MLMLRRSLGRTGMAASLLAAACLLHCDDDRQPSCEGLGDEATLSRMNIERAAENRACSTDADCVAMYHPLSCFGDCGDAVAVSRSREEKVAADVAAVDAELCGQREQLGCPAPIVPPCAGTTGASLAICRDQQCDIQPLLLE
jgi:hypothetical protein